MGWGTTILPALTCSLSFRPFGLVECRLGDTFWTRGRFEKRIESAEHLLSTERCFCSIVDRQHSMPSIQVHYFSLGVRKVTPKKRPCSEFKFWRCPSRAAAMASDSSKCVASLFAPREGRRWRHVRMRCGDPVVCELERDGQRRVEARAIDPSDVRRAQTCGIFRLCF